jgi:hypothetical protein
MALIGLGAVIIWNDIAPEGRADFYDWHINEHIPERVAIAGFLRGRRYIAADEVTSPEFLTLYETENENVLSSANYLARLNDPTPWTRRATAHFRNTSRCLTTLVSTKGAGISRYMATLRIAHSEQGLDLCSRLAKCTIELGDALVHGSVTGLAVCLSDIQASNIKTTESSGRTDILQPPIGALLIEGVSKEAVETAMNLACSMISPKSHAARGVYMLEFSLAS